MKYRPQHIAEYVALRAFAAFIRWLPYRVALAVAWYHAALLFFVFRFRRAETQRRIHEALGEDYNPRAARRIAWISLRNMVFNGVEMIRASDGSRLRLPPHIDHEAAVRVAQAHLATGKGAIFVSAHMGNWELAGLLAPTLGIPMFTIVAVQKNPLVNAFIQKLRQGPGVELVERGRGTMRAVLRKLKQGKVLAVLADLRSRQPGVHATFLGKPANLYPGAALFALTAKVPVFLCYMRRNGWAHHSLELAGPLEPDHTLPKAEAMQHLTQQIMDALSELIRNEPEQWFWYNSRWVLEPLEAAEKKN